MAVTNKSNTPKSTKDYWRSSPELVNDALRLLGIPIFNADVCCLNKDNSITESIGYITEENDALELDNWHFGCYIKDGFSKFDSPARFPMFCNPPFSKKWLFFQKAKNQAMKFNIPVLMVLPYTPCTKEWADNVHGTDCIIYVPDGRYQYLLPDGSKPKSSCNFETCFVLIVPFKCGNVTINFKRGL